MNFLNIAGHLGADPEIRFTSSGQKVTTLRVACRARKSGSEENTIWWRVTVWGEQFDKMISYLKKGSPVVVFGEMNKPEIFKDREGNPQISMSMTASNIMFSPFGKSERQGESQSHSHANVESRSSQPVVDEYAGFASGQQTFQSEGSSNADDEIPF